MDSNRPLILVSNDDGYDYNGLQTLIRVARRLGDVFVAVPAEHQSGKSSAISLSRPVRVIPVTSEPGLTVVKVTGTPADSVKLAVSQLLADRRPDLVVAGINHGYNMGVSTLYSGTMACVFEALMHRLPGVAFSLGDYSRDADTDACEPILEHVMRKVLAEGLPPGVCLNVNIPPEITGGVEGMKVTTSDMGQWVNEWEPDTDENGERCYRMGGEYEMEDENDDRTDMYWLKRGHVTITPCHMDQTNHASMARIAQLLL